MPAIKADLLIEQGATFQRVISISVQDGSDLPDLTQYSYRGMLRTNAGVFAANFTVVYLSSNTLLAEISAVQTKALIPSSTYCYKYDIEIQSPSGIVYRLLQGNAKVSAQQTRDEGAGTGGTTTASAISAAGGEVIGAYVVNGMLEWRVIGEQSSGQSSTLMAQTGETLQAVLTLGDGNRYVDWRVTV